MTKQAITGKFPSRSLRQIGFAITLGLIVSAGLSSARAEVILSSSATATSAAFDLDVDGTPSKFTVFPRSGSASTDTSPIFMNFGGGLLNQIVGPVTLTGQGGNSVHGNIDQILSSANSNASADILDLDLTVASVLSATAGEVESSLNASLGNALAPSGKNSGLTITVLGTAIVIPDNAPLNDVVFDDDGVKVTVNQLTLDPTGDPGGTLTALAIELTLPELTGTIDVANSFVNVNAFTLPPAAPELATWAMMLIGFAGLGYAAVRRSGGMRPISR